MRVMVLVPGDENTEQGVMPDAAELTAMGNFNEELVKAGVMLAGEGLHPTGPFTETKELIAGYWLWQVRDMDEAIEWIKRAPFDDGVQIELRPVFEEEDFGDEFTPELREQERRLRAQVEEQQS